MKSVPVFWTMIIAIMVTIFFLMALTIISSISAIHASDSECLKTDKNIKEAYTYMSRIAMASGVVTIILILILVVTFYANVEELAAFKRRHRS